MALRSLIEKHNLYASEFLLFEYFKKITANMVAPNPSARRHPKSHRHRSKRSRCDRSRISFETSDDSGKILI